MIELKEISKFFRVSKRKAGLTKAAKAFFKPDIEKKQEPLTNIVGLDYSQHDLYFRGC